jgi:EAL domain-containing protein (putative c-di-GMP-specific phosphodiesterase class I)
MSASGYETPEHVLRDADTAMYRAKSRGRGGYEVFDPEMHHEVSSLMRLETDLRHAVDRKEFVIYYQPIVSLETTRLTGFEALVRWQHPDRGLVNPNEFIAVAEETGLILPLGQWVLEEACRQLREWKSAWPAIKDVYVAVNLSGRQLTQPDFAARVRRILQKSDLAPESLKLEITESMLMESEETVVDTLNELRALGVRLLIDDFGTGYSSLNYLHRFPVDHLKIDRSFISRMSGPDSNPEIVRTIINLAGNLQLKVIAEGVETFEQMNMLRGIHVEEAQGFYFSRPLDSKAAGSMFVGMPVA